MTGADISEVEAALAGLQTRHPASSSNIEEVFLGAATTTDSGGANNIDLGGCNEAELRTLPDSRLKAELSKFGLAAVCCSKDELVHMVIAAHASKSDAFKASATEASRSKDSPSPGLNPSSPESGRGPTDAH